jgi:hypothetical protein
VTTSLTQICRKFIFLCASSTAVLLCGIASPLSANAAETPIVKILALCDVESWRGREQVVAAADRRLTVVSEAILEAEKSAEFTDTWRKCMSSSGGTVDAHRPEYGIRFVKGGEVTSEATISFRDATIRQDGKVTTCEQLDDLRKVVESVLPHPAYRERKIYWQDWSNKLRRQIIMRSNLDGTNPESVLGVDRHKGSWGTFCISPDGSHLYLAAGRESTTIWIADRDGNDVVKVATPVVDSDTILIEAMEIDPSSDVLYWTGGRDGKTMIGYFRDWKAVRLLEDDASRGLCLDPKRGRIWWAFEKVSSMLLDGTELRRELSSKELYGQFLTIEPEQGKLFFLYRPQNFNPPEIHSADLDGSRRSVLAKEKVGQESMLVYDRAGWLYWNEYGSHRIWRLNLETKKMEPTAKVLTPNYFAVDPYLPLMK